MAYTVKKILGCDVIFGGMPVDDFAALMKKMPQKAILDDQAAHHLGATFVAGMPEDTKKLLALPPCEAIQNQVAYAKQSGLSEQAADWLLRGEQGASSKAMFSVLAGFSIGDKFAYPLDPSDLRRCRLLLDGVPELVPRIGEMSKVNREWAALIARWDEICRMMDEETPEWRDAKGGAPKTYAIMKECLDAAKRGAL